MSSERRTLGFSLSLGLLLVVLAGSPADAAGSAEAGWWTATPAPLAPDAPGRRLVVQGGIAPDQPLAYAAIAYELNPGEVPMSLTLTVADQSASTAGAELILCPLTEAFAPEQGGRMDNAPSFDCAAMETASPDGSSYAFDVSGIYRSGSLALAILAGAPTARVVLEPPAADALQTASTGPGATEPEPPLDASDTAFEDPTFPGLVAPSDLPSLTAPAQEAARPSVELRAAAPTRGIRSDEGTDDDSLLAAALFGVLLLVAAALWVFAGTPAEPVYASTSR